MVDPGKTFSQNAIKAHAENIPDGALRKLYQGQATLMGGAKLKDRMQFAFGAQFVEVRVNMRTREIRAPRVVGAYAGGRIVNPKAAKSQLMGSQIWGVSAALHEATEIDRRAARYTNGDLAEYLIPVNADVQEVATILLPEQDAEINPLDIKGIGELGRTERRGGERRVPRDGRVRPRAADPGREAARRLNRPGLTTRAALPGSGAPPRWRHRVRAAS